MKKISLAKKIAITVVLFLLILPSLLSLIIEYLLSDQLEQRGANNLTIEQVWVNPYSGDVSLQQVAFSVAGTEYKLDNLTVKITLPELFNKVIRVEAIALSGVDLDISIDEQQELHINGLPLTVAEATVEQRVEELQTTEAAQPFDWRLALTELTIDDVRLLLAMPDLSTDIHIDNVKITDFDSFGEIPATAAFTIAVKEVAVPSLDLNMSLTTRYNGKVEHGGIFADVLTTAMGADLTVSDIVVQAGQINVTAADFNYSGDTQVTIDTINNFATNVGLTAMLQSDDVAAKVAGFVTEVSNTQLQLNTQLALGVDTSIESNMAVTLSNALVKTANQQTIASMQGAELTSALSDDTVTVSKVRLTGIDAFTEAVGVSPSLVTGADVTVDDVTVVLPTETNGANITVAYAALPKAMVQVLRGKQGELPQFIQIEKLLSVHQNELGTKPEDETVQQDAAQKEIAQTEVASEEVDGKAEQPLALTIAKAVVGPAVTVAYTDKAIHPALRETATFETFAIDNFVLNDKNNWSTLAANIVLTDDTTVTAKGKFNVFSQNTDVDVTINEFQLSEISGYVIEASGYAIQSGELDVQSAVKIADRVLDVTSDIVIDNLALRETSGEKAASFTKDISMSVDQAVDLLRDSNDQIKLSLPVSGSLDNPDVDIQQVINKALTGAMAKTSMLAMKSLLQPYGALITVAQYAGSKATEIKLDPITFEPNSAELDALAIDYGSKVAAMMIERDALKIKLCAASDDNDLAAMSGTSVIVENESEDDAAAVDAKKALRLQYADELNQLAEQRAQALRQFFVEQKQVSKQQLIKCLPQYTADTSGGRVELSI